MEYSSDEHRHRLSAWAAGRAASVKGSRFKVGQAKAILEFAGFNSAFCGPDVLPSPELLDVTHRQWRRAVIRAASRYQLRLSHGVAAKLINCYLKVRFVCSLNEADDRVMTLHPPIDRVLLSELANKNIGGFEVEWRNFMQLGWSNFDSKTYENVIARIRLSIPGQPLWKIEQYWKGHQ
jgi:hypothetical protein